MEAQLTLLLSTAARRRSIRSAISKIFRGDMQSERERVWSPVARLPEDVLAEVFQRHVRSWRQLAEARLTSVPHWSVILRVCGLWRHVAIHTPALWTQFSPTSAGFVQISLERAGVLPLHVLPVRDDEEARDDTVAKSFELILPHVTRLRGVEVTFTKGVRAVLGQRRWDGLEAPLLEELVLRGRDEEHELYPFTTMKMPKLRKLVASEGSFTSLKAILRSTITELDLRYYWRTDTTDILALLAELPLVERLTLRDVCDCESIDPFEHEWSHTARETVSLPHLQYIVMSSDAAWLLPSLAFPLETRVLVAADGIPDPKEACIAADNIKKHILMNMHAPSPRAASGVQYPTALDIRCSCPGYMSMEFDCCFRTPPAPFDPYPGNIIDPEDRLHFILTIGSPTQSFEGLTKLLFSDYDGNTYGTITRASISTTYNKEGDALWDYTPWQAVFRALPNLHTLHLSFDAVRAFATYAFVQQAMAEEDHYQEYPLLYPSLKVLRLTSARYLKHPDEISKHDFINKLVKGLKWTKSQGLCLERLEIETPVNFAPACLSMIKETQIAKTIDVMDWGHEAESESGSDSYDGGEDEDEDGSEAEFDEDEDDSEDEGDSEYDEVD